ncbi:MAG: hypothetical protein K6G50_12135 [bacterium]|nr:hypothetical protein [bacterium]
MSGPKSSTYIAVSGAIAALMYARMSEAERRRVDQRRAYLNQKAQEIFAVRAKVVETKQAVKKQAAAISQCQQKILEIQHEIEKHEEFIENSSVKALARELSVKFANLAELCHFDADEGASQEKLWLKEALLNAEREKSDREFNEISSLYELVKKQYDELFSKLDELLELMDKDRDAFHHKLDEAVDMTYRSIFAKKAKSVSADAESDAAAKKKFAEMLESAEKYLESIDSESLPFALRSEIASARDKLENVVTLEYLHNFRQLICLPLGKRCQNIKAEYERWHSEYEALRNKYESLCYAMGMDPQETSCTEEGVSFLRQEAERLDRIFLEKHQQEIVRFAIDETMKEMGCELIGTRNVTKRSGKQFRNELFDFGEGAAVNVTYAQDGTVTMELGGLDEEDRSPDSHETEELCGRMEEFCGKYQEICQSLKAKGLESKTVQMCPPTAEFAQIINTSDYDMKTETKTLRKARRKQAESKVLKLKQE